MTNSSTHQQQQQRQPQQHSVCTGTSYSAAAPRFPAMGARCRYGRVSRGRKSDSTFFFLFGLTFTSQILDKLLSRVSSLLPPGTCLQFFSRIGFSIPTARRFSSCVANSRFRAFGESILCTRKSRYEFIRVCTRGDSNSRN